MTTTEQNNQVTERKSIHQRKAPNDARGRQGIRTHDKKAIFFSMIWGMCESVFKCEMTDYNYAPFQASVIQIHCCLSSTAPCWQGATASVVVLFSDGFFKTSMHKSDPNDLTWGKGEKKRPNLLWTRTFPKKKIIELDIWQHKPGMFFHHSAIVRIPNWRLATQNIHSSRH